jgi:translation initiation factor IF-1
MESSMKEELIVTEGKIDRSKGNSFFTVKLENGEVILARVAGRSKRVTRELLPGVEVRVELSPYDLSMGRIIGLM